MVKYPQKKEQNTTSEKEWNETELNNQSERVEGSGYEDTYWTWERNGWTQGGLQ